MPSRHTSHLNRTHTTNSFDDTQFALVPRKLKITKNPPNLQVGARLEQSCTSPINVTTNPLEHFSGRKTHQQTQQATIVVQQPSVNVDHHTVSTVLLKNGGEFVSNVQQQEKLKQLKQKEDNVKQLLDVANNLTLEEIHDFEMR